MLQSILFDDLQRICWRSSVFVFPSSFAKPTHCPLFLLFIERSFGETQVTSQIHSSNSPFPSDSASIMETDVFPVVDKTTEECSMDVFSSFLTGFVPRCYSIHDEYAFGIGTYPRNPSLVIQFQRKRDCLDGSIIVVNVAKHSLIGVCEYENGEEKTRMDVNRISHCKILDLSVDGDRWEGDVMDGKPFGYGHLFDKNGELCYSGFRIGSSCVCYGTFFQSSSNCVEYQGFLYNGQRCGSGCLVNRQGVLLYDGDWIEDGHSNPHLVISASTVTLSLHNLLEDLHVKNNCCNTVSYLSFDSFNKLRSIDIGNDCFKKVNDFSLHSLPHLQSLIIGDRSFSTVSSDINRKRNEERRFCVRDCPEITKVSIGCFSFSDACWFTLESTVISLGRV